MVYRVTGRILAPLGMEIEKLVWQLAIPREAIID